MSEILSSLLDPEQLQEFDNNKLAALATELRQIIIDTVASNGGHLASNLGMVELTLALLAEFDFRHDKIVFDVGHQCYSWKLLTGRLEQFSSLRQKDGLSGFPKRSESPYDFFNTGHSSTSISAALGLARAMEKAPRKGKAIAIIGDGALTGGMAYEALNDAGQSKDDLLVILNDNQMSISKNVGGMSKHLENLRISQGYINLKGKVEQILGRLPLLGKPISRLLQLIKSIDRLWLRNKGILFEQLGFRYYGLIDGHDITALRDHLAAIRNIRGPVLLHVLTQKGKGYTFAEEKPDLFHGVAPFVIDSGVCKPEQEKCNASFSTVFGEYLLEKAKSKQSLCAVSAAMTAGTGLTEFSQVFPNRFFDVGIAEQHALTMGAGLAAGGLKAVIAIYSTFLQRAYDQLLHDICLQNLPVVIAIDRAGLVSDDGETHQGLYDISLMLPLPNLTIFTPFDEISLKVALDFAVEANTPVAIRYPRSAVPDPLIKVSESYAPNKSVYKLRSGQDCTIAAVGAVAANALEAAKLLDRQGINCEILAIARIKPFDNKEIFDSCKRTGKLILLEEGIHQGSFSMSLHNELITSKPDLKITTINIKSPIANQTNRSNLLQEYNLDAAGICRTICKVFYNKPINMHK